MIQINLFPVRKIKRILKARNEIFGFAGILAVFFIILGLYTLTLLGTISDINANISMLEQKKADNQPILDKIEEMKKAKESLDIKLEIIKQLRMNSQVTVRVLDEIATRTPSNRLWLTNLQLGAQDLVLTGVALDNATIAEYMKGLTESQFFESADLKSSALIEVAGRKLKSFSLSLVVTIPGQKVKESDAKPNEKNKK